MRDFAGRVAVVAGAVHLLRDNAGVTVRRSLLDATCEDWDRVRGVDAYGVVHGIQTFLPRMLARGDEGHVVNTRAIA